VLFFVSMSNELVIRIAVVLVYDVSGALTESACSPPPPTLLATSALVGLNIFHLILGSVFNDYVVFYGDIELTVRLHTAGEI